MSPQRASQGWQKAKVPWGLGLEAAQPADPYLLWAALIGFSTSLEAGEGGLPFLFQIDPDWPAPNAGCAAPMLMQLAVGLRDLAPGSQYPTAMFPRKDIALLWQLQALGFVLRFQLGAARGAPSDRGSPIAGLQPLVGLSSHTLGVVDDGCALAHVGWRSRDGLSTRLVAVWDQQPDAKVAKPWQVFTNASGRTLYGVELSGSSINLLLQTHPGLGEIAERAIYCEIDRTDWGRPGRTHGARVMSLLDGQRRLEDRSPTGAPSQPEHPLVFVQLPSHTAFDTSGGSIGFYVLDGVRYIVDKARLQAEAGSDWRCTVVLSVGSLGGPHDGSSIVDRALAELVDDESGRVEIVAAAGNAADQRLHAERSVTAGQPARFDLLAAPDNPRESFVELWMPSALAASARVSVTTPAGRRSSGVRQGNISVLRDARGEVTAALVFPASVPQGEHRTMALLALMPTAAPTLRTVPLAPPGVWSIEVRAAVADRHTVHAWIERNDTLVGSRAPQRTRFVRADDDHQRRVDEASTLSSLAHGDGVRSAGGYVVQRQAAASYSGRGPALEPATPQPRPDYFGPSDSSDTLPGVRVPGFFSGQWRRMSGTSAAAPRVGRWLAFEQETPLLEVQEPDDASGKPPKRRRGVPL